MNKQPTLEEIMVRKAIETLTINQQRIWSLWNYDRLTQEEIAGELDIKPQSVNQAIKAIENKIKKYCKQNRAAYMLLKLEQQIMNEGE